MAASDFDPYLYPGTQTLRNKLGIRDPAALERAQDELAAQRYNGIRANPPTGPFTFDILKDIHRRLFQDVFEWAGEVRTIGIRKAEWTAPGSRTTRFADPELISDLARMAFDKVDEGRGLMNLDRAAFAARAAEFLNTVNMIHPFREGNGRAQRLLLTAMGAAAGHTIAFEVATHERMVATSIAAERGDLGGFTRLIEEATDPRRVEAMRKALGFLKAQNVPGWNDTYIATTTAGQSYSGLLAGQGGTDFMLRVPAKPQDWIAIGDAADLPPGAKPRQRIEFTATRFSAVPDRPAPAAAVAETPPSPGPCRSGPSPGF